MQITDKFIAYEDIIGFASLVRAAESNTDPAATQHLVELQNALWPATIGARRSCPNPIASPQTLSALSIIDRAYFGGKVSPGPGPGWKQLCYPERNPVLDTAHPS